MIYLGNKPVGVTVYKSDTVPAGCEIGTFTVDSAQNTVTIQHSLGEVPKFAVALCVPNRAYADMQNTSSPILFEALAADPETMELNISGGAGHTVNTVTSLNTANWSSFLSSTTYTTYPADMTSTSVTFATGRYYSGKFAPGETYIYILTK